MPYFRTHGRARRIAARTGFLLLTATAARAQFTYETNAGYITITGYSGSAGAVAIPDTVNELPVTTIGLNAFAGSSIVTSITIPGGVSSIQDYAFQDCSRLTNVTIQGSSESLGEEAFSYCANLVNLFFGGSPPSLGYDVFAGDDEATAYYLPGAIGWSTNLDTIPTALWNPVIQTAGGNFGFSSNQFGFTIAGAANIPVVVEACTNLANPIWIALQGATLDNGAFFFSEPATNGAARFYRISSP
jgi:hypothetical protein